MPAVQAPAHQRDPKVRQQGEALRLLLPEGRQDLLFGRDQVGPAPEQRHGRPGSGGRR